MWMLGGCFLQMRDLQVEVGETRNHFPWGSRVVNHDIAHRKDVSDDFEAVQYLVVCAPRAARGESGGSWFIDRI